MPAGTVTVINNYSASPTTNLGGVVPNNGFFTVPLNGRYSIATFICFANVGSTVAAGDVREIYIYRVDATSGLVTTLAMDSRPPVANAPTCVNVATIADLNCGDRVFVAARQVTVGGTAIGTIAQDGRFAITRVC